MALPVDILNTLWAIFLGHYYGQMDVLYGHNNKQHRNNYTTHIPKSNLSVNNFPTLPPIPSMPPTLTSLSNYSLSRNHTNLNNQNYYHLGPRTNYSMESPYNTTLSVPISQTLHPGYNNARVSFNLHKTFSLHAWPYISSKIYVCSLPTTFLTFFFIRHDSSTFE